MASSRAHRGGNSAFGGMSRRDFLRIGGAGLAGASLFGLAGCGESDSQSGGEGWKQYKGMTLNFISENTAPTSAIAANLKPFKDLTGIDVKINQLELGALVQKVSLDVSSGDPQIHVIYADPYQVLAPFSAAMADLNKFNEDDSLPSVQKGVGDFIPTQLAAAGRFEDEEALYALPYDCPTMIWMYRKDLFDKYGQQMQQDLGFDPMPSEQITWDQYFRIAQWFNENADEVSYGTGHQAKQYDSLMCDFSNILWSYGGDYFENGEQVGRIGTQEPGPAMLDQDGALEAAEFYNRLVGIAHPGSTSWDWTALDEAFRAGEVAMAPNWHEFAAGVESSDLGGKVAYERLPGGPTRSASMWGGTGIGINGELSEDEQRAAWLFLVWATSPETQLSGLKSDVGGGTPTRQSIYEESEVQQARQRPSDMPNILTYEAVSKAWDPENIGLRPKIEKWNECDTVIFTELSKMLAGDKSPEQAMQAAKEGFDQANGV
ncbi:MAG: extracellular solute-binding protein [Rubrobacteraceae bacterium]